MPSISQKRNNRLNRVIKNLISKRSRFVYLNNANKDLTMKDSMPKAPNAISRYLITI